MPKFSGLKHHFIAYDFVGQELLQGFMGVAYLLFHVVLSENNTTHRHRQ